MKKLVMTPIIAALIFLLALGPVSPAVYGAENTDAEVQAVIEQLESIDTLQQMQNKRSSYVTNTGHYDTGTTDTAIINAHETARSGYESYISTMFAARAAAQQAYDALSDSQKAQIDSSLTDKLHNELPTVFNPQTLPVTPGNEEYTFDTVKYSAGYGYEISNHMVSGEIPQTFILVDTSDGKTSWTPDGKYVCGESNYEVAYCCDVETPITYGTDYKRVNLEDSSYYGTESAKHIRAILQNSYPYITVEQMKANLKNAGMDEVFVNSLTRSDMISAVQMAIWSYANVNDGAKDGLGYFASIDITKNTGIYFTPLHDTNNECWDWLPKKRQRSYDALAEYRVNNLAYYLMNLEGVEADEDQIIISDVEVTRADLLPGSDDTYKVGMYVHLNSAGSEKDNMKITATSYSEDADGAKNITARTSYRTTNTDEYQLTLKAKQGDTIKVVVEGTQHMAKGIYLYEPEGGRDTSQTLVGVGEGETKVKAEKSFEFVENVNEKGLRIYKTANGTDLPIQGITFDIYQITSGMAISDVPTEEEIAEIQKKGSKVTSVITDETGYASAPLDNGTYLIIEQHNAEKTKAPVSPFYITIPMQESSVNEDGTTSVETVNIVSVYPKNEPTTPPEEPPVTPPTPDEVTGNFSIIKHDITDENKVLQGAEFKLYAPVAEAGLLTKTVTCNGVEYAVEPVETINEEGKTVNVILTTDENGSATSPDLPCGTYFLVETTAPDGYYKLDEAIEIHITSSLMEEAPAVLIANQPGAVLPSTGGAGTMMFYLLGGTIVLLAGCLLLMRRRSYS